MFVLVRYHAHANFEYRNFSSCHIYYGCFVFVQLHKVQITHDSLLAVYGFVVSVQGAVYCSRVTLNNTVLCRFMFKLRVCFSLSIREEEVVIFVAKD